MWGSAGPGRRPARGRRRFARLAWPRRGLAGPHHRPIPTFRHFREKLNDSLVSRMRSSSSTVSTPLACPVRPLQTERAQGGPWPPGCPRGRACVRACVCVHACVCPQAPDLRGVLQPHGTRPEHAEPAPRQPGGFQTESRGNRDFLGGPPARPQTVPWPAPLRLHLTGPLLDHFVGMWGRVVTYLFCR